MTRVQFCGAIGGSVTLRKGETPEQAIQRAQDRLLDLMDNHAKLLGFEGSESGPNIGLERDPTS